MKTYCLNLTCTVLLIIATISMGRTAPAFAQAAEAADPGVVQITATDYAFRMPDAIPSGWTTLRFVNDAEEAHFVLMSKLPEGKSMDDYEMLQYDFSQVWEALLSGEADQAKAYEMLGAAIPEWFPQLQFAGGPGFLAPGRVSEMTLQLEPGNYALECYMKTEDGEIHYMEGMVRPLTVTDEDSGGSPPAADIHITLSNFKMDVEGALTSGKHSISVHVKENPEEGFGHNAQLVRLDADTDVNDVVAWMDWFDVNGMRMPAPAEFIGGVQVMPAGNTAYFTAELEPGRYGFVSEYTAHQGVLHEFTVAP